MTGPALLDRQALEHFPLPVPGDGGKQDHGRLLVVAGSRSLPGAALLCATAAMRAGAGTLAIATVESVAANIGTAMPESRTVGVAECDRGGFAEGSARQIAELAEDADAVVAGPGMFESEAGKVIAAALLRSHRALALDAGLLRSLPGLADMTKQARIAPLLLPHAGEMASLLGCTPDRVEADPAGCGRACAERYGAVTLVKGATSHVVHPDGRSWVYRGGAHGLGVSGSGDTLAGIAGGLLARGADPLTALLWAVVLHGEAGERLCHRVGPVGFLAREIPGEIPALLAG